MNYKQALARSLELNAQLKHSNKFARPIKDKECFFVWDVEIIDSAILLKQHEDDAKRANVPTHLFE